jgi:hypothetical protein
MRAKSPCLEQGCGKLVDRGRCPAHTKAHNTQRYAERNQDEVSKWYRTKRWVEFRAWFLRHHPVCQRVIDGERCYSFATLIHHRISPRSRPDLFLDEDNCRALCSEHHHGNDGDRGDEVYAVDNW